MLVPDIGIVVSFSWVVKNASGRLKVFFGTVRGGVRRGGREGGEVLSSAATGVDAATTGVVVSDAAAKAAAAA